MTSDAVLSVCVECIAKALTVASEECATREAAVAERDALSVLRELQGSVTEFLRGDDRAGPVAINKLVDALRSSEKLSGELSGGLST